MFELQAGSTTMSYTTTVSRRSSFDERLNDCNNQGIVTIRWKWKKFEDLPEDSSHLTTDLLSESIIQRLAAGDETAVSECLDKYGALVWSLAKRMFANLADAEDIVQEIFVEIWRNAHRYNPELSSEATFITLIARRRMIDRTRKVARRVEFVGLEEPEITEDSGGSCQLEVVEEAAKAEECLKSLREEQQQVLRLSILDGLSHEGIARKLEKPLGSIKSLARRGLLQVRECMKVSKRKLIGDVHQ